MKPRIFLLILFVLSSILLFIDAPFPIRIFNLNFDPTRLNINLAPINLNRDLNYKLGLDLQGGTRLIYQVDMEEVPENEQNTAFESARAVIERRINFFGVTEPSIQALKAASDYRIIVELPGTTDVDQALSLIGKTAQLSFWEEGSEKLATEEASLYPLGLADVYKSKPAKTKLSGKDLKAARVVYGSVDGTPQVQLNFTAEGAKIFAEITTRNIGKPVAIVLDEITISAPIVQQQILTGDAVISGSFTQEQAKNLAIQLNAGALPAPLKLIGQSTVGPSLGIESLRKSLAGGLIGLISLIVFMIVLYRREGVLASIALVVYSIIVLFIFKIIPVTLTLAGIAGFILSIGMAVDANILIFERMREELRNNKPRNIAIKLGFNRAWPSIRDSNISSLITTFILFYFGSGLIRGFALALAIGILVSMFSAITVTRNLLRFTEGAD
ncbi:MAG: protein-export membrane protein SecD [Candidatus Levybacteria bacterium RIFCSPHIGHO2_02_FULL_40_18]|nr:MAG: protein-export membrane protein SecD [Candidatus Levybacteria bacterium RIFCSPHIGHO2_01_FULL_40_58]OGH26480.1 MAG: protein-export membrane protein SecD [Candidatus Levybacteria bacterium RIFCSPHIGHO2_02_FULL_40_18]OGH31928.1 MAG: protein-export membrane protein SecD [Candidatus Levybacteria bacterium RIFCSPHIGHO2_12_FULL_40_31]OGH40197.1 MAG: protein-export membrane protein SecD [Candidatus Levybacteria bacterium RIFCSPLOWO2_01_FULL_40_64]OGH49321.1 MAG: protein-export membrane protein 